ncbi:MAG: hypothetical protein FWC53_03905 [Firmicutes bacterium]|nr:hypothetical protein [Bacillota bacterium]
MNAINLILLIGGFVILFSVIISILENSSILSVLSKLISPVMSILGIDSNYAGGIIAGFIELTNGVSLVSLVVSKTISVSVVICSFLIGFRRYICSAAGIGNHFKKQYIHKTVYYWQTAAGLFRRYVHISASKLFPAI